MVHVSISSHADLQALQCRSDRRMFLKLVSLESVDIASDSYALLRNLIDEQRNWQCPQIDLLSLSLVASAALELHKIKHLFPLLVVQEATLEGDFLKALLLLKDSAVTLICLAEDAKVIVEDCVGSLVEMDVLLGKVGVLGKIIEENARLVLKATHNLAWLQARVSNLLDLVDVMLSTLVHFPNPK